MLVLLGVLFCFLFFIICEKILIHFFSKFVCNILSGIVLNPPSTLHPHTLLWSLIYNRFLTSLGFCFSHRLLATRIFLISQLIGVSMRLPQCKKDDREDPLTPKGLDYVYWLYNNFGQVPMTRDFQISGWNFNRMWGQGVSFICTKFHDIRKYESTVMA